jgi:hypothetical protein
MVRFPAVLDQERSDSAIERGINDIITVAVFGESGQESGIIPFNIEHRLKWLHD